MNVLDLFCGIGGLGMGFRMAGFKVIAGIDSWPVSIETFRRNNPGSEGITADLTSLPDSFYEKYAGKVGVIIAGPPCQGFSMSGRRDRKDPRNVLFWEVVRAARIIRPKVVVIENVVGLLSMKTPDGNDVKKCIETKLEDLGYSVEHKILNAADYGVPQNRRRVIFIASKIGSIGFPAPSGERITVGDALGNIPESGNAYLPPSTPFQKAMYCPGTALCNHDVQRHSEAVLKRISFVPPGGNWKDIPKEYYNVGGEHSNNYRRLDPGRPAVTIKHAQKSMIIHPYYNRVITASEAARLQSFPDSFILSGTKYEQHQQLANAVPPLMAKAIAESVRKALAGEVQATLDSYSERWSEKGAHSFTFIDLFAGIGGFRLGMEKAGGRCVFSSEIDRYARETYRMNFGEYPAGDIKEIDASEIPDHDILAAGFPCQPFSIAGKRLGFSDTRGTLFFEIERVLLAKKPKAFILENVAGLVNHNHGDTFRTIKNSLKSAGYHIFYKILNARDYGVPQNRERIFIVGFRSKVDFSFPPKLPLKVRLQDLLEENPQGFEISETAKANIEKFLMRRAGTPAGEMLAELEDGGPSVALQHGDFPAIAMDIRPSRCYIRSDGISPCLTAKMGTGGNNVPVLIGEYRRLTVRECLRLMGFPDSFSISGNSMQQYKQIGNSVVVPIVEMIVRRMLKVL